MYPSGDASGPGSMEPAMPCTTEPSGRRTGIPVLPSEKRGEHMPGPAKATVERSADSAAGVDENGPWAGGPPTLIPTYLVCQPEGVRSPMYGSKPWFVG